jgi:hypothetical protein
MSSLITAPAPKQKWLSKDRFWNFVFWFGMSGSWIISSLLGKANIISRPGLVIPISLITFPVILLIFNRTTFVKDTIFKNSEGIEFDAKTRFPNFFLLIVGSVGGTILTGLFLDTHKEIPELLADIILCTNIFGIFSLFFIYKNCPISIIFNSKAWNCAPVSDNYRQRFTEDSMATKINSIKYSYSPINRHHRR